MLCYGLVFRDSGGVNKENPFIKPVTYYMTNCQIDQLIGLKIWLLCNYYVSPSCNLLRHQERVHLKLAPCSICSIKRCKKLYNLQAITGIVGRDGAYSSIGIIVSGK
ncbi:hypothetical protein XELAEV_18005360mg [Xenopus laevis]|uniref:Uncharacterized protein n=1 Tax=Xenopus laevis TaxID=8355 RepID=A0A974DX37_XENLA|nr:hypothetical protein XELAEV_18005360mg [Xenopus laevis]